MKMLLLQLDDHTDCSVSNDYTMVLSFSNIR